MPKNSAKFICSNETYLYITSITSRWSKNSPPANNFFKVILNQPYYGGMLPWRQDSERTRPFVPEPAFRNSPVFGPAMAYLSSQMSNRYGKDIKMLGTLF